MTMLSYMRIIIFFRTSYLQFFRLFFSDTSNLLSDSSKNLISPSKSGGSERNETPLCLYMKIKQPFFAVCSQWQDSGMIYTSQPVRYFGCLADCLTDSSYTVQRKNTISQRKRSCQDGTNYSRFILVKFDDTIVLSMMGSKVTGEKKRKFYVSLVISCDPLENRNIEPG